MTTYRDITRAVIKCPVCGVTYYPDNGDVCECPESDDELDTGSSDDAINTTFHAE